MALAYDERRATRDVDAVFAPKAEVYAAAARVAERLDLPEGWLNDAVKGFLLGPDPWPTKVYELPALRCEVASPQMVVVLKCLAHRTGEDDDDVRLLARHLGLGAEEVLDLLSSRRPERAGSPQPYGSSWRRRSIPVPGDGVRVKVSLSSRACLVRAAVRLSWGVVLRTCRRWVARRPALTPRRTFVLVSASAPGRIYGA